MPSISVPFRHFDRGMPTWHIMPILLGAAVDRNAVIERMKADGVQTSIHYPAVQSFTAYRDCAGDAPLARDICGRELTLPLYPTMTDGEVDLVCESLERALST
jgi:dTDP-4-amino-4,6-dideoxygalactose transaminase